MPDISLHFKAACSHSWLTNSKSMLPCRALKAFGAGLKALFGKYKVTITEQTKNLIRQHPNSYFAKETRHLCSWYIQPVSPRTNITIRYNSERPPAYDEVAPASQREYASNGFVMPNERGEFPPRYTPIALPSYKVERDNLSPPPYENTTSNPLEPAHT
ncbi:hypothetical protein [Endozoicomonas elysicola]|uniref:Uncharacterized protein n=1 Tax=Endozoicomonas elysicola TaxID=305900 RepID=A0A081KGK8_9GAMM|nr:hypothetical protein [Endozoicomonas elysicola]KEI73284.1 hypothetical protein GV64_23485 [Endozoicomonas elysicola]